MVNEKKIAKGALTVNIFTTELAKQGLNLATEFCKTYLCGVENLTNQFVNDGIKLDTGKQLQKQSEEAVNWAIDKLIQGQKAIKESLS